MSNVIIPIEVPKKRGRPPGSKNTKVVKLPPKETPVVTPTAQSIELPFIETRKIQGTPLYSRKKMKAIEEQTGLIYYGSFAEQDSAYLIPFFARADRSEEDRQEKLTLLRRK